MRWSLALSLLALGCAPDPAPLDLRFDTAIPNVAVGSTEGELVSLSWALDRADLGRRTSPGPVLIGLPQGARVFVRGTARPDPDRPDRTRPTEIVALTVPRTGLPDLEVLARDPDRSELARGYVAAAVLTSSLSGVGIYDGEGRVVWGWTAPEEEIAAHPVFGRDQASLLAFFSVRDRTVDGGVIRRFALDGSAITETVATGGHHAFVEQPEGSLTWLSRNPRTAEGFDLLNDTVRVAPEGSTAGGTVVFDLLDAVPFYIPCPHFDPLVDRYGWEDLHDWSHANSLVYDAQADEWILGVRLHDAILGIDAATWTVRWTAGGPDPDLLPDDPWSHAHFTEARRDEVLLFDNGVHADRPSRVLALALDPLAGAATVQWSFDQPEGGRTDWLGDAHTLPGGNRLIALTTAGRLLEVTPEGEVVFDALLPEPNLGRIRFTPTFPPTAPASP